MHRVLSIEEFREQGRRHSHWSSSLTKAWKSTLALAGLMSENGRSPSYFYQASYPHEVNFGNVTKGIRYLETGQHHSLIVGQLAWNTIADINNSGLAASNPNFIISWTPHIHPDFRNGPERRAHAAARLTEAYDVLSSLALAASVEHV